MYITIFTAELSGHTSSVWEDRSGATVSVVHKCNQPLQSPRTKADERMELVGVARAVSVHLQQIFSSAGDHFSLANPPLAPSHYNFNPLLVIYAN